MALTYANYFLKDTRTYDLPFGDHHVLLYDLVMERTGYSILDRLRDLDPTLRNASCVVLRGRTREFLDQLKTDKQYMATLGDTPTIALVGSLGDGNVKIISTPPFRLPEFEIPLTALRAQEIRSILDRNVALFGPTDEDHFDLPSGDHAEAFLRLGQALQEPVEISRIADWILPYLGPKVGIVADNGSLLPLIYSTVHEALRTYGWTIPFRTINSYPDDHSVVRSTVNDLYRELGPGGSVLLLVSVSSSGRLVDGVRGLLLPMPHSFLVICNTSNCETEQALLNLPIKRWRVDTNGKCPTCDK